MEEWKVGRRKPTCSKCEREFGSEEVHFSGIFEVEARFERADFCISCWESGQVHPFSHWKTVTPKKVERRLEDIEAMSEFFQALCREENPTPLRQKVTYLTALLLMRKRKLKRLTMSMKKINLTMVGEVALFRTRFQNLVIR